MRFHSKPIEEHAEVPLADAGRLEHLVEHWTEREAGSGPSNGSHACYVLSVHRREDAASASAQLAEMTGLVAAQGDRVVGCESQLLVRPDARTYIRSGVAQRISQRARACGADMLVMDAELSPSQTRNLEEATGFPICDREAVILNVFERRAATRRARLQVQIAHLEYLRPRIRGLGLNMDQQTGGLTKARGPGETASELLARQLDGRLADLRRGLSQLKRSDQAQRQHRENAGRVALVGYTNAGKTSLMNALTCAGLSARDRPFETLDTTSRSLARHGGDVLLSDTVGFIRRLPERLLASFESTLAEVSEASLLLLVVDVSDPEAEKHLATTRAMLEKLDAGHIRKLVVWNKLDRAPADFRVELLDSMSGDAAHVALSSHDPDAVAALKQRILTLVREHHSQREIFVPYERTQVVRRIYAACRVLSAIAGPRGTQFIIEAAPEIVEDIARSSRSKRS